MQPPHAASIRKKSLFLFFFLLLTRSRVDASRQWPWIKRAIKHHPPLHHSHSGSRFLATASESAAHRTARSISRGGYKVTPGNLRRCWKKKTCKRKKPAKTQEAAWLQRKARKLLGGGAGQVAKRQKLSLRFTRLTRLKILRTSKTCTSSGCRQPFNNAWTWEGGNQYRYVLACYIALHVRMLARVVYISYTDQRRRQSNVWPPACWEAAKWECKHFDLMWHFGLIRFVYWDDFYSKKGF